MTTLHPLADLARSGDAEALRGLLAYYREQEKRNHVKITCSDFRDGELLVVNYTDSYNESTPPENWDWRMEVARGCVLFKKSGCPPEIVVKPMVKFHGYEHCAEAKRYIFESAVAHTDGSDAFKPDSRKPPTQEPDASSGSPDSPRGQQLPVTCMQKFDGSCVLVTVFRGELLLFTRGAIRTLQTQLARELLSEETALILSEQMEAWTLGFELIHDKDAKVENNRGENRLVLLYACDASTGEVISSTNLEAVARKIKLTAPSTHAPCEVCTVAELREKLAVLDRCGTLADLREGFVVEMAVPLLKKYKVKSAVYKKLARSGVPQPTKQWLDHVIAGAKSWAGVEEAVVKMRNCGVLDYGAVAERLLQERVELADKELEFLRDTVAPNFSSPKEVGLMAQDAMNKGTKTILFAWLAAKKKSGSGSSNQNSTASAVEQTDEEKIRVTWFASPEARLLAAKEIIVGGSFIAAATSSSSSKAGTTRVIEEHQPSASKKPTSRPGSCFPVRKGRLVLCGAPGMKTLESWAKGLDFVVTLLRDDELQQRGLSFAAVANTVCADGDEWSADQRNHDESSEILSLGHCISTRFLRGRRPCSSPKEVQAEPPALIADAPEEVDSTSTPKVPFENEDLAVLPNRRRPEWVHLPISGAAMQDAEKDRTAVTRAAALVAASLLRGKTVAVHCSAGLHRTGIVGYTALRILGFSQPMAFELLGQGRQGKSTNLFFTSVLVQKYKKISSQKSRPLCRVAGSSKGLLYIQRQWKKSCFKFGHIRRRTAAKISVSVIYTAQHKLEKSEKQKVDFPPGYRCAGKLGENWKRFFSAGKPAQARVRRKSPQT
ncbi:unnamed protein product [Amoebophrya sp. A120]|nr:unnamed protein product [Amoebophrya sp. A120]|eukprot:GSA120T00000136001.1